MPTRRSQFPGWRVRSALCSTVGAIAIVNAIKSRTAELLVGLGAMPPVISRASAVGTERSRELFDEAYREHARRLARAIDQQGGG